MPWPSCKQYEGNMATIEICCLDFLRRQLLYDMFPAGIELLLNSRVLGVSDKSVKVANKVDQEADIPFGACVWATGLGMHPLVHQLKSAFPAVQSHSRYGESGCYLVLPADTW
jgi:hypothetical protein